MTVLIEKGHQLRHSSSRFATVKLDPFRASHSYHTHDSANPAIPPAIRCVVRGTLGFVPPADDEDDGDDEDASLDRSAGGSLKAGFGAVYRSPVKPPPKGFEVDVDIVVCV